MASPPLSRIEKELLIRSTLLELDLRETQKTLMRVMMLISPDEAVTWKASFVERRRELIERNLIRFEQADPALCAEIQESLADDFSDWLEPGPEPD